VSNCDGCAHKGKATCHNCFATGKKKRKRMPKKREKVRKCVCNMSGVIESWLDVGFNYCAFCGKRIRERKEGR